MPEGKRTTEPEDQEIGAEAPAETAAEVDIEIEAEIEDAPAADLEAEVASLKDQLLRALAETENLRRRSQRERADAVKYAAAPLIKDLVGVADNLRRAMDSIPAEAVDNDEHLKTLLTGLEMTEKELAAVFERHDIVKIDPMGEVLDPHFHEAMFEIPDPNSPSGTVLQVLQAGYRLHDRLLRPAQVGVAKGGPAPAKTAEPAAKEAPEPNGNGGASNGNGSAAPGSTFDTSA